ncbi:UNVERIFIED_CONTAM: hypothetical protein PYX00_006163 [Menopon gallinae]|uniref:Large ribosomal subunit protein uL3m n=1 Tax=Menopon gallinae TaxID=328185 RepID=A0AAW2HU36_9NEOP
MSLRILSTTVDLSLFKAVGLPVCSYQQKRFRGYPTNPKLRTPYWHAKKEREPYDELLTEKNQIFLDEYVSKRCYIEDDGPFTSPLKEEPVVKGEWFPNCVRSGLIGIKIGMLPQWLKNGELIWTTLLQVVENQVIKYIPPGKYNDLRPYAKKYRFWTKGLGDLVVGAINSNPLTLTKEYCNLFAGSGVPPKSILTKFPIHPEAIIQPGTPLYAAHFKVGDYVDVTGKTMDRGFQGVMKRWGFHGMPSSHGQTKTHRRPGNIGAGGDKSRVWPGQKMPGHMGNKMRTANGLQIVRINHKENVLYVHGVIPGQNNSIVYIHDTHLVKKKLTEPPRFPTYYPELEEKPLPNEEYCETIFNLNDPTIMFEPEAVPKKRR